MDLRPFVQSVPDFPQPGILFRDITPLLADPSAFEAAVEAMTDAARTAGARAVVGIESRGFVFGAPLALRLGVPFLPLRKAGKLPRATLERSYALEYGEATLELHRDDLPAGTPVVIVDDLLATGGTARAACELVEEAGGEVALLSFLIELTGLRGRQALGERPMQALLSLPVDGSDRGPDGAESGPQ